VRGKEGSGARVLTGGGESLNHSQDEQADGAHHPDEVPASTACGLRAGSLMVTGMFSVLSEDAMNTWGWRVPFLLAGPLGLIGRYIRVHLEDSPAYQEMRAEMPQEQKTTSWSEPPRPLRHDHLNPSSS